MNIELLLIENDGYFELANSDIQSLVFGGATDTGLPQINASCGYSPPGGFPDAACNNTACVSIGETNVVCVKK